MANNTVVWEENAAQRAGRATLLVEQHIQPYDKRNRSAKGLTIPGEIIAKITVADSGTPTYEAKQVIYDTGLTTFSEVGRTWSDGFGSNLPKIREIDGGEGIPVGTIIKPFKLGTSDSSFQWFFSAGGTSIFLLKITSGGPGDSYLGEVFGNGADSAATATGVTIRIAQIVLTETIPAGTFLLGIRIGAEFWGQVPVFL